MKGRRHESLWHAGDERLGAGSGTAAGGSDREQHGERADDAHRGGWSVPATDGGVSGAAGAAVFTGASGPSSGNVIGGAGGGGGGGFAPAVLRFEPGHPDADKQGYVAYPQVDPIEEMTDLLGAVRAYELNASAIQATKGMITQSLDLLR